MIGALLHLASALRYADDDLARELGLAGEGVEDVGPFGGEDVEDDRADSAEDDAAGGAHGDAVKSGADHSGWLSW